MTPVRSDTSDTLPPVATVGRRRRYAPRLPPAERRTQLLDAALRIIIERGYPAVSIEAVARAAGVTRPVVYSTFPGLPVLLTALHRREQRRAYAQIRAIVPEDPGRRDPDRLVAEGVEAFLRAVVGSPDTWRLILLPVEGTPELVRRQVKRDRERVLGQLRGLVAWGLERRGGPGELEVELAARMLMTLCEEAGRLTLTDPAAFTPERLTAFARALLGAIGRGG
jgi:AcrR family transcriptional regulator